MTVKQLLRILLNSEQVKICKDDGEVEWCGYAFTISKKYYNDNIDKVYSFPSKGLNSYTYIIIK